ncbi:MAG: hypothetical protein LBH01_05885 [Verrucomicrobiales bacterium]|jgi:hypothetical protein|nr:hypothetical protein [Verrucomicrobiales bacterium]
MKLTVLIAAFMISGAILLNGYLNRISGSSHFSHPSNKQVEKTVIESFNYAFSTLAGDNIIMSKKRDVEKVKIGKISYSENSTRMLVEFTLFCKDGDQISSGIGLNRDEFGTYRGVWDFGESNTKQAIFVIETK